MSHTVRRTGVCQSWKGSYGFVDVDDGGPEVFVHQSQLEMNGYRLLEPGERVEIEFEHMPDGRRKATWAKLTAEEEKNRAAQRGPNTAIPNPDRPRNRR